MEEITHISKGFSNMSYVIKQESKLGILEEIDYVFDYV